MTLATIVRASIATAWMITFAGCTDLKPIQAEIDALKSKVTKLQSDTARALSDAAAAKSQAASSAAAAAAAQSTANQALANSQSNSMGIEAINDKIDRMFHRTASK
jgi:biopolymer transport protein ExbB/TolQ